MKKTDFSFTGKLPLSQDRLDYMQQAYVECFKALAVQGIDPNAGANIPLRISGMLPDGLGNIGDGYYLYNEEIIAFTGGAIPTPAGGSSLYLDITTIASSLVYNNAATHPAIIDKSAALATHTTGTAASSSGCPYDTMQEWGREKDFTTINISAVTSANLTGTVLYKKNFINNTIHLVGSLLTISAGSIATSPVDEVVCLLPVGYRPGNLLFWQGQARGASYELDADGDRMGGIYCALSTNGFLNLALIKPASGQYQVVFNIILPLD